MDDSSADDPIPPMDPSGIEDSPAALSRPSCLPESASLTLHELTNLADPPADDSATLSATERSSRSSGILPHTGSRRVRRKERIRGSSRPDPHNSRIPTRSPTAHGGAGLGSWRRKDRILEEAGLGSWRRRDWDHGGDGIESWTRHPSMDSSITGTDASLTAAALDSRTTPPAEYD